jgi:hypothetical protein
MKSSTPAFGLLLTFLGILLTTGGCGKSAGDPTAGAPPPANVVPFADLTLFSVEHP